MAMKSPFAHVLLQCDTSTSQSRDEVYFPLLECAYPVFIWAVLSILLVPQTMEQYIETVWFPKLDHRRPCTLHLLLLERPPIRCSRCVFRHFLWETTLAPCCDMPKPEEMSPRGALVNSPSWTPSATHVWPGTRHTKSPSDSNSSLQVTTSQPGILSWHPKESTTALSCPNSWFTEFWA